MSAPPLPGAELRGRDALSRPVFYGARALYAAADTALLRNWGSVDREDGSDWGSVCYDQIAQHLAFVGGLRGSFPSQIDIESLGELLHFAAPQLGISER